MSNNFDHFIPRREMNPGGKFHRDVEWARDRVREVGTGEGLLAFISTLATAERYYFEVAAEATERVGI